MANYSINPNQIIRLDGKNCFLEVMKDAFSINKVLFRFYSYDANRQAQNRITRKIFIYMSFKDFYVFYYEVLHSHSLIRQMRQLYDTKQGYERHIIISRGGKKVNGSITARNLKIFKGDSKPVILQAEEGPGKENSKGGYTMAGRPTQYIPIPMENEDLIAMLSMTYVALQGHFAMMAMKEKMEEVLFEQKRTFDLINALMPSSTPSVMEILNRKMPKPWEQEKEQDGGCNNENRSSYGYNENNSNGYDYNENYDYPGAWQPPY